MHHGVGAMPVGKVAPCMQVLLPPYEGPTSAVAVFEARISSLRACMLAPNSSVMRWSPSSSMFMYRWYVCTTKSKNVAISPALEEDVRVKVAGTAELETE